MVNNKKGLKVVRQSKYICSVISKGRTRKEIISSVAKDPLERQEYLPGIETVTCIDLLNLFVRPTTLDIYSRIELKNANT